MNSIFESVSVQELQSALTESKLTAEEIRNLKDSDFGLPDERRYPMPDKEHVLAAIKFFNYVEKEKEIELAKNICKKIGEFGMTDITVGDKNRFKAYFDVEEDFDTDIMPATTYIDIEDYEIDTVQHSKSE
jgi:hypothetical protein